MHNHEEQINGEGIRNPEVQYERRDMGARGVVAFLIGLAVAGLLIHIVLWGMYKYLAKEDLQRQPAANPMRTSERQLEPQGDPARTFPEPRLQPSEVADMNKFRQREEEVLNSYSWVDQKAGVVRVPITRAMELLAQRGLPTRQQPPATGAQAPESRK
jgi:hypothetical protein